MIFKTHLHLNLVSNSCSKAHMVQAIFKCNMNGNKHLTPWNRILESISFKIFILQT
jgi:hypothetical protein